MNTGKCRRLIWFWRWVEWGIISCKLYRWDLRREKCQTLRNAFVMIESENIMIRLINLVCNAKYWNFLMQRAEMEKHTDAVSLCVSLCKKLLIPLRIHRHSPFKTTFLIWTQNLYNSANKSRQGLLRPKTTDQSSPSIAFLFTPVRANKLFRGFAGNNKKAIPSAYFPPFAINKKQTDFPWRGALH